LPGAELSSVCTHLYLLPPFSRDSQSLYQRAERLYCAHCSESAIYCFVGPRFVSLEVGTEPLLATVSVRRSRRIAVNSKNGLQSVTKHA
jgi:hypothetical protein